MSVSLKKGSKISLQKEASVLGIDRLSKVAVGLGWDCNEEPGKTFDLDAWALAVNEKGIQKKNLVYYSNTLDSSNSIRHMGDNLTGAGDGDDETSAPVAEETHTRCHYCGAKFNKKSDSCPKCGAGKYE